MRFPFSFTALLEMVSTGLRVGIRADSCPVDVEAILTPEQTQIQLP